MGEEDSAFRDIWFGHCPPKVEMFVWQLIHGRILVKEVLLIFGVQLVDDLLCPLCAEKMESIDHLFLLCGWAWNIWQCCMRWWGVFCCPSRSIVEWWKGWMNLCPWKISLRAWRTLFFAVVWTIWDVRNQKVFKAVQPDSSAAVDMVKFRLGWWFKHFGRGSETPITLIILNIVECCSEKPKSMSQKKESWVPPLENSLFFNVDGAVTNPPGPAGIGGVLRDHNGKIMCVFSSYVGIQDVVTAELLAIIRACDMVSLREELFLKPLTVISDSNTVVNWILGSSPELNKHEQIIGDIRRWLGLHNWVRVEYRSRWSNSFADTLAKKGLNSGIDELWWSV